ncbi:MAG: ABC transporter ATP-binding protein [Candidatus Binatia bacterium]|nr:ABC transporter ATP-binding protein [Candidatus Binatia bacterium]
MPEPVLIETHHLGKCYRLYRRRLDHVKEILFFGRKRLAQEFWALRDVSLQVRRGEAWGVIGENGAGKSTFLKLLCGITLPSQGVLAVRGRIGALLELGIGFHPEYTGRENLYLSGALMGIGREELHARLPAILEFADIGDFIDRPLKTYSSGMTVRLAFALATSIEPEILVTDEVLAVGDEAFQKKCIRWMERFLGAGGTLLLCSHNSYHIRKLCQQAVWLWHGQVRATGEAHTVVQEYLEYLEEKARRQERSGASDTAAAVAAGENRVREVRVDRGTGEDTQVFSFGDPLRVHVVVEAGIGEEYAPVVLIGLVQVDGLPIYGVSTDMDGVVPQRIGERLYAIDYEIPELNLLPGRYLLRVHALDGAGLRLFDTVERQIVVRGATRELGVCRLPHRWTAGRMTLDGSQES